LRRTKGNKQAAAKLLGLKRTTLVAKLRRKSENSRSVDQSADEIVEL
jgi:DNA-binding NtrC family response regulator